jgi:hypothetical protein
MNRLAPFIGFVVLLLFTSGCSLVRPLPGVAHGDPPRPRMPFIENRGQTAEAVKFYAPIADGTVFVTSSGEMTYALRHVVLTEALVGGTVQRVTGTRETPTKVNVLRGNDPAAWRTNLPTYDTISLGEVYAGIDIELQASGTSVEKLFYVKPGANPAQIRIAVTGGRGLAVAPDGELDVATAKGTVRFTRPIAYQEGAGRREHVDVAYVVDGERYGFRLGTYDRSRRLVIDPVLKSTFLGGDKSDSLRAVVVDGAGNVYVAGHTASPQFPGVGRGSADAFVNPFGDFDGFIAKLNADLSDVLVATFVGGSTDDVIRAIVLDGAGHVYVTGGTASPDLPGIGSKSAYGSLSGSYDAFVARLDTNLATIHSTYLGGADEEEGRAIALDGAGSVYVAGTTTSDDFPMVGGGSADATYAGFEETFVARLDANLSAVLAATYLGGSAIDRATALALDASGHVYVAGYTSSSDFPGVSARAGSADTVLDGNWSEFMEGFIVKLDTNLGTILGATFLGGSGADNVTALALDATGNVYAAGSTGSYDFPGIDQGSADPAPAGFEAFVAKLDPALTKISAATYFGGSGNEFATGVAVTSAGKIYLVGETQINWNTGMLSYDMPGVGPSSADPILDGKFTPEGFVAKFDGLFVPGWVLVKDMNGLAGCPYCPPDPTQILLAQIDRIMQDVLRGDTRAAVSDLMEFQSTTQSFVDSGQYPADVGRQLIDLATQAIAELMS